MKQVIRFIKNHFYFTSGIASILGLFIAIAQCSKENSDVYVGNSTDTIIQQNKSDVTMGDVNNNTNSQININSPHSTQSINNIRRLKKTYKIENQTDSNGNFITDITIEQTDGIWNQGEYLAFYVELSQPYKSYDIVGMYRKDDSLEYTNDKKTSFSLRTTTPPPIGPIVLTIKSEKKLKVLKLDYSPKED
ncbi:MAG: hypothetical protein HQM16_16315 [Deltaproteobacteria bacterium]|nr:hypothetical protein [Deltaproteobacteria bacterium]